MHIEELVVTVDLDLRVKLKFLLLTKRETPQKPILVPKSQTYSSEVRIDCLTPGPKLSRQF